MKTPKAILFDLDDTLTDREATLHLYASRFLEAFKPALGNISLPALTLEIRRADAGGYHPKLEVAAELLMSLPWLNPPTAVELEAFWLSTFPRLAAPMPGLNVLLETLRARGVRLGVVTNGRGRAQHPKLDVLGIRSFLEVILVSEDMGVKKPDRRIFELALEQLRLSPHEVWMVGDHPVNDTLGARAAGLTGVWFKQGYHAWPGDEPRGLEIDALPGLLELLGN